VRSLSTGTKLQTGQKCEDCHKMAGSEKTEADKQGKDLVHPDHAIHQGKVSCQVCHSMPYKNCYSCHVGKDELGAPYFETAPSKMDFKIGLNPKTTEKRPEKYVIVRHVPVNPGLFDFYVKDALTNMDAAPTWKFATPHNIQLKTPQNETCRACHGNNKLFLAEKDLESWEVKANKDVVVPLKPAPSVRHNWLEQSELHLKKVDCTDVSRSFIKISHKRLSAVSRKRQHSSDESRKCSGIFFNKLELYK